MEKISRRTILGKREVISKRVKDLIEKGSIKERALLICKEWKEKNAYSYVGEKPTINQKEVDALKSSTKNEEEKLELQKWLLIYDIYESFTPRFAMGLEEYYRQSHIMEGYFRLWKEQESKVKLLNYLYMLTSMQIENEEIKLLLEENELDLYQSMGDIFNVKLLGEFFSYGKLKKKAGEKFSPYYLDLTPLKEEIEENREELIKAYTTIKAIILTLEHFWRKTSSQKFIPQRIKEDIAAVKQGYLAFDIGKEFSCKELRLREERGEEITEEERAIAIFPEYDSLEVSKREREFFEGELITIINEIANVKTKE